MRHKTFLSEVAFENLRVGDCPLSVLGNEGEIIALEPNEDKHKQLVKIKWQNGGISLLPHFLCTQIEI